MKVKYIFYSFALALLGMNVITSCSDDDPSNEEKKPTENVKSYKGSVSGITISKPEVTNVSSYSATFTSTMSTADDNYDIYFIYSTNEDMSDAKKATCRIYTNPKLSVEVNGLSPQTTYYVYSVLKSSIEEDIYSETSTFTTPELTDLSAYAGPIYADDYRNIASWDNRDKWNLSNVHDPSVMLADDGYYYMYQTDASFGNAHVSGGHFHARRSKNLIDWEYLGGTMQAAPSWVLTKVNEYRAAQNLPAITSPQYGFWAPCARKVRSGLYRMYYSIILDNNFGDGKPNSTSDNSWTERAFIGVMETTDPSTNAWEDKGFVLCSSTDRDGKYANTKNKWEQAYYYFNAIDPSYIITPEGEHWLIYGSWHSGIAAVQLDPNTGKTKEALSNPWGSSYNDIKSFGKRIYTRKMTSRWQASEGPEVVYHDGYYYMFLAYDALDVPYNTRVVRSQNIDGPYLDMYGTDCTNVGGDAYPIETHPYKFTGDRGWVGISHCAVFDDGNGNWFYASQARFPNSSTDTWAPNAVMMGHVRSILWGEDGWPIVMPERYGAVPQLAIKTGDLVGEWEHIDMAYETSKQRVASSMVFAADGNITSGIWKGGKWSFDESTQILTANGVKLYLKRECDWETAGRPATIVYAGHGAHKTYWGKKVAQ